MSVVSVASFIHDAESETTYMSSASAPARAWISEVFPEPGTPWRRYPRRKGMPRVAYHFSDCRLKCQLLNSQLHKTGCVSYRDTYLEEVLSVIKQHLLHALIQDDGA